MQPYAPALGPPREALVLWAPGLFVVCAGRHPWPGQTAYPSPEGGFLEATDPCAGRPMGSSRLGTSDDLSPNLFIPAAFRRSGKGMERRPGERVHRASAAPGIPQSSPPAGAAFEKP